MSNRSKFWYAKFEGWMSLLGNLFLFGIKYWAGVVSGSIALIADAWHTLSDSFSSIVVLFGVKISQKPPDKDHPFGHGRAESVASIVIGFMLVLVGIGFIYEGILKFINHEIAEFGNIAIVVTVISLIVKEVFAQFAIRWGKKFKMQSLISDGWHHRSDAISSLVILVGIFVGKYYWWIDGVLGGLVGILIAYSGFKILLDTINPLLGETPSKHIISKINSIGYQVCNSDIHLHHVHVHNYGDHSEVTFHMRLPGEMNLIDSYNHTFQIRNLLRKELNLEATIYVEPLSYEDESLEFISFNFEEIDLFNEARKIRHDVFVEEQLVDEKLEFDGLDPEAHHFLVKKDGVYLATARYRKTSGGIKLERFAVSRSHRSQHIGTFLLLKIKEELYSLNQSIYLHAQDTAVEFYQKHGFIIEGNSFEEANIIHFKMTYQF